MLLVQGLFNYFGLNLPYFDSVIFTIIKIGVVVPIVGIVLTPLNRRLKMWRKKNGRDIDDEERYETESGFIKLTPNNDKND